MQLLFGCRGVTLPPSSSLFLPLPSSSSLFHPLSPCLSLFLSLPPSSSLFLLLPPSSYLWLPETYIHPCLLCWWHSYLLQIQPFQITNQIVTSYKLWWHCRLVALSGKEEGLADIATYRLNSVKTARGGDIRQTDIVNYRLNWPRGQFNERNKK